MNRKDAARLPAGATVQFAETMWTAKAKRFDHGTVVRVTPKGGVLVRVSSGEMWVPYHHIISAA